MDARRRGCLGCKLGKLFLDDQNMSSCVDSGIESCDCTFGHS